MRLGSFCLVALLLIAVASSAETFEPQKPQLFSNVKSVISNRSGDSTWLASYYQAVDATSEFALALNVRSTFVKTLYVVHNDGQLLYFPPRDELTIGNDLNCPENGIRAITDSIHELGHAVLEAYLRPRLIEFSSRPAIERLSILTLRNPYDELFADTYAVFASQDPRAMSKSLEQCGEISDTRDFAGDYDLASWGKRGRYEMFDPVREVIFKELLGGSISTRNRDQQKRLLFSLAQSIETILREQWSEQKPGELWHNKTPAELNEELIQRIKLNMN